MFDFPNPSSFTSERRQPHNQLHFTNLSLGVNNNIDRGICLEPIIPKDDKKKLFNLNKILIFLECCKTDITVNSHFEAQTSASVHHKGNPYAGLGGLL